MGHYWSEMRDDGPERHPKPLEALEFHRVEAYASYNQYYHKPCLQMFYIQRKDKLPDAIWRHAKECS